MKTGKPKIAIIAGTLSQVSLAAGLEALHAEMQISFFAFNSADLSGMRGLMTSLLLFDPVPDMPGYMRGLEDHLSGFDAIIGVETFALSSFQALRAAQKFGVPFGCITTSNTPFAFVDFSNIRAIQTDIFSRADFFWPLSSAAKRCLKAEGVSDARIQLMLPTLDTSKQNFSRSLRTKFRKYIGVPPEAFVAIVRAPLEAEFRPMVIVEALSILRRAGFAKLPTLRVVFAGDGALGRDLRYRASDAKIGGLCMFLSQDLEPFLRDLHSASDAIISLRAEGPMVMPSVAASLISGLASGLISIVNTGTPEAEWSADLGVILDNEAPTTLAMALGGLISAHGAADDRSRLANQQVAVSRFGMVAGKDLWSQEIGRLLTIGTQKQHAAPLFSVRLRNVSMLATEGSSTDALVEIEEMLLTSALTEKSRAELLCLKGETLSNLNDVEAALEAFQTALQIGEDSDRVYRGLGFLSVKSHSHEEALTFFKKALGRNPRDSQSMLGIALVYRRLKLHEDSLYWAEQCLHISPQNISGILLAAQTALETNGTQVAVETLERLRESTGDNKNLLVALAQLYVRIGRVEMANDLLALAGEKPLPDHPTETKGAA